MAKNIYKTAQGQVVDVDTLRLINEGVIAVGNMSVNARGDQVAPDGTVVKTRNERMKEHYRNTNPVVKYNPNRRRGQQEPTVPDLENMPKLETKVEEPKTLRGSLASSTSIDLIETPPVLKQKTLSRI